MSTNYLIPGRIYKDSITSSDPVYLRFVRHIASLNLILFWHVSGPDDRYEYAWRSMYPRLVFVRTPAVFYEVRPTEIDHLNVKHLNFN